CALRPQHELDRRRWADHYATGFGRNLWHDRRTHLSRRTGAGPDFHHAAAAGLGPISHADSKSLSMRFRHTPWRWTHRYLRRDCGAGDFERAEKIDLVNAEAAEHSEITKVESSESSPYLSYPYVSFRAW